MNLKSLEKLEYNRILTNAGLTSPHQDTFTAYIDTSRTISSSIANYRTYYGKGEKLKIKVTFTSAISSIADPKLVIKFGNGAEHTITNCTVDNDYAVFSYTIGSEDNGGLEILNLEGTAIAENNTSIVIALPGDANVYQNKIIAKGKWNATVYNIKKTDTETGKDNKETYVETAGQNSTSSTKKIKVTTYQYYIDNKEKTEMTESDYSNKIFAPNSTMVDATYDQNGECFAYNEYTRQAVYDIELSEGQSNNTSEGKVDLTNWTIDDFKGYKEADNKTEWLDRNNKVEGINGRPLFYYDGTYYANLNIVDSSYGSEELDQNSSFDKGLIGMNVSSSATRYLAIYKYYKQPVYFVQNVRTTEKTENEPYSVITETLYDANDNITANRNVAVRKVTEEEVANSTIVYTTTYDSNSIKIESANGDLIYKLDKETYENEERIRTIAVTDVKLLSLETGEIITGSNDYLTLTNSAGTLEVRLKDDYKDSYIIYINGVCDIAGNSMDVSNVSTLNKGFYIQNTDGDYNKTDDKYYLNKDDKIEFLAVDVSIWDSNKDSYIKIGDSSSLSGDITTEDIGDKVKKVTYTVEEGDNGIIKALNNIKNDFNDKYIADTTDPDLSEAFKGIYLYSGNGYANGTKLDWVNNENEENGGHTAKTSHNNSMTANQTQYNYASLASSGPTTMLSGTVWGNANSVFQLLIDVTNLDDNYASCTVTGTNCTYKATGEDLGDFVTDMLDHDLKLNGSEGKCDATWTVTDKAGNTASGKLSDYITLLCDDTAPTVEITGNATNDNVVTFTINKSDPKIGDYNGSGVATTKIADDNIVVQNGTKLEHTGSVSSDIVKVLVMLQYMLKEVLLKIMLETHIHLLNHIKY